MLMEKVLMKVCPNCGLQSEDNNNFCPNCGQKLETIVNNDSNQKENFEYYENFRKDVVGNIFPSEGVFNDINLVNDDINEINLLFEEITRHIEKIGPMAIECANAIKSHHNQDYYINQLKLTLHNFDVNANKNFPLIFNYYTKNLEIYKFLLGYYCQSYVNIYFENHTKKFHKYLSDNLIQFGNSVNDMRSLKKALDSLPNYNDDFKNVKNEVINTCELIINYYLKLIQDTTIFMKIFNKKDITLLDYFEEELKFQGFYASKFIEFQYEYEKEINNALEEYNTIKSNYNGGNDLNFSLNNLIFKMNQLGNFINNYAKIAYDYLIRMYKSYIELFDEYGVDYLNKNHDDMVFNYKKDLTHDKNVILSMWHDADYVKESILEVYEGSPEFKNAKQYLFDALELILFISHELLSGINDCLINLSFLEKGIPLDN